jgi:hypothetical protein
MRRGSSRIYWCILDYPYYYYLLGARGGAVVEATNRKVAGSLPDDVIGNFHWHNPSGRTMALGSTQPLREIITRNISLG